MKQNHSFIIRNRAVKTTASASKLTTKQSDSTLQGIRVDETQALKLRSNRVVRVSKFKQAGSQNRNNATHDISMRSLGDPAIWSAKNFKIVKEATATATGERIYDQPVAAYDDKSGSHLDLSNTLIPRVESQSQLSN